VSDKEVCQNCASCDDWWSPTDSRSKCYISGNIIEDPEENTCDDWEPNDEIVRKEEQDELTKLRAANAAIQTKLDEERGQAGVMREALEFYADEANYAGPFDTCPEVSNDEGDIAHKALTSTTAGSELLDVARAAEELKNFARKVFYAHNQLLPTATETIRKLYINLDNALRRWKP
jgi:hypothetical protein